MPRRNRRDWRADKLRTGAECTIYNPQPMPLAAGTRLGDCEILSSLGSGGMGEVYRARDHSLGREVAVKVLPEQLAANPEQLRRFEQEARAAGALNHPNI